MFPNNAFSRACVTYTIAYTTESSLLPSLLACTQNPNGVRARLKLPATTQTHNPIILTTSPPENYSCSARYHRKILRTRDTKELTPTIAPLRLLPTPFPFWTPFVLRHSPSHLNYRTYTLHKTQTQKRLHLHLQITTQKNTYTN